MERETREIRDEVIRCQVSGKGQGRRGRPAGYIMSEDSKRAIAESKRGHKQKEETKEKIRVSVIDHFGHHPNSVYGEKRVTLGGYVEIYTPDGWVSEHRAIAEAVLGRPLKRNEVVHHLDRNKKNNSRNNLAIMTNTYHLALHHRLVEIRIEETGIIRCTNCGRFVSARERRGNRCLCKKCYSLGGNKNKVWKKEFIITFPDGSTKRTNSLAKFCRKYEIDYGRVRTRGSWEGYKVVRMS